MSHTDPPPRHASAGHDDPPGPLDNPEVAHEHSDVDVRALIGFTVGMFVVVALVGLLMGGLFRILERQAARNDPQLSPLAAPPVQMPPTTAKPVFSQGEGPRLLTDEPSVLGEQRVKEAEALGTYGWVDEKSGVARIPISEAKKLILQRGLPTRSEGAADATLGTRRAAYGESSSGRLIGRQDEGAKEEAAPAATPPAHKGHGQ